MNLRENLKIFRNSEKMCVFERVRGKNRKKKAQAILNVLRHLADNRKNISKWSLQKLKSVSKQIHIPRKQNGTREYYVSQIEVVLKVMDKVIVFLWMLAFNFRN